MASSTEYLANLPAPGAFAESTNLQITELTTSTLTGYADLDSTHHQPYGIVHGGLYATIVETVGSVAGSFAVHDQGKHAVGVNNSTHFFRPFVQGRILISAQALQQGKVQQLWEVVMRAEETGKEIARGHLRVQNVPSATAAK